MKKSISVNISGMLFNIEEDAYERLHAYLNEVKRYFAGYKASEEIVADIENRIAEIFSTKVGPYKQVLTSGDVESLIAQMGNVQDFAAIEDSFEEPKASSSQSYGRSPEPDYSAYSSSSQGAGSSQGAYSDYNYNEHKQSDSSNRYGKTDKRLYRDVNNKVLGGVAAGLAHYLKIDPMWLRLALLCFVVFDVFVTFAVSSSALVIGYIIMWIAVPANTSLTENKKVKKMFRNPDNRMIAGVAGGLGTYFGIDPVIIRIAFAVTMAIPIYIILWICMPKARTLTDRMQMEGEAVTLANIEQQVKKRSM